MFINCKVLDLCCGDGTYSFLFFADISSRVDAVDYDDSAISYANKYYKHPKINFQKIDIINQALPSNDYDVVVWNAGICYFNVEDIGLILKKIINSSNPELILCGMLPKANGYVDHKTEFENMDEVRRLFEPYFHEINIEEVVEGTNVNNITFYFDIKQPKV